MNNYGISPDELIVDNFAGGGGASTGIEMALGRPVDIAINHDPEAIAMHRANHPETLHLCENVWAVDIAAVVAGRKVGFAWFSPDCTFFSKARGSKPIREKGKEVRGLAWVVLKWAGLVKPRVIGLENVEEFQFWGPVLENGQPCKARRGSTFKRWATQLRNLGYKVEKRELRACDYGAPTIRKRLFIIARRDGEPIVWPEPTHGPVGDLFLQPYRTAAECIDWSIPCHSIFLTRDEGRKVGVNRPLAEKTMARIAKGVKRYVINAAKPFIIPLTHHGAERSNDIQEPLPTVTGAHRGEQALAMPYITEHANGSTQRNFPADEPLRTQCAEVKGGHFAVVSPSLSTYYGTKEPGNERTGDIKEPLRTQGTENRFALVSTFLQRQFGQSIGSGTDQPVGTVTAGGQGKTALMAAHVTRFNQNGVGSSPDEPLDTAMAGAPRFGVVAAHLAQHNSERSGVKAGRPADEPLGTVMATGGQINLVTSNIMKLRGTNVGSATDEPLHTASSGGTHHAEVRAFLMKYFGTDQDPRLGDPLHSITTKDRFALVTVEGQPYMIVDIGMRMLTPRELFLAQGFPASYVISYGVDEHDNQVKLTKTAQVRMCGNSVSPYPAAAIVAAQFGLTVREVAA